MKYTTLPNTDIKVSKICLGTMTFGQQNTEAEGHEQMDYALERGVNFFDTAEMYSVPASEATYGSTEKLSGLGLRNQETEIKWFWLLKSQVQIRILVICAKNWIFLQQALNMLLKTV